MSRKASKRRGRPIVVDGTRYYWKVRMSFGLPKVSVLLPTGRRIEVLYHEVATMPKYDISPPHGDLEITPSTVAAFIRRTISQ